MDSTTKGLMIIEPKSIEEKLKYLMDQVCWAVNHYEIVSTRGIIKELKDAWEVCEYSPVKD